MIQILFRSGLALAALLMSTACTNGGKFEYKRDTSSSTLDREQTITQPAQVPIQAPVPAPAPPVPAPPTAQAPSPMPVPAPPTSSGTRTINFGVNLAVAEFGSWRDTSTPIYPTAEELDYFKSKGLISIRLPFLWERIQNNLNQPLNATELQKMKTFVAQATQRNVKVILDMHNYARYKDQLIGSGAVP